MPITYTNRKGLTFYLCKGVTKKGKPRYYFAREPKGEPVEQIPDGFTISESVNGVVSLAKVRPMLIQPAEIAVVEAAVRRHPQSRNYRVSIKHDRIEICERTGASASDVLAIFKKVGLFSPSMAQEFQERWENYGQFKPILRFILLKGEPRTFWAQRWCYLGSDAFFETY